MIVVHETSANLLPRILQEGLKPRKRKPGNWFTNEPGNRNLVYLVSPLFEPKGFHAFHAALANECDQGAIIHVDLDKVDQTKLRVDENFLDIEKRSTYVNCPFHIRKEQVEKALHDKRWKESLEASGMIAYKGNVPPEALVDYKILDNKDNFWYRDYSKFDSVVDKLIVFDGILSLTAPTFPTDKKWYEPRDVAIAESFLDQGRDKAKLNRRYRR